MRLSVLCVCVFVCACKYVCVCVCMCLCVCLCVYEWYVCLISVVSALGRCGWSVEE